MSDLVMILTGAISLVTIILVALIAWKGSVSGSAPVVEEDEARPQVGRRNVRSRMQATRQLVDDATHRSADEEVVLDDLMTEGKIGAKKRKKLEMKAEKRAQRDRELEDREERKQRQAQEEERRKQEEELQKEAQAQKEAEEKRLQEEKERKELEEYLKLKETFSVEDQGYDAANDQAQNKLQEFVDHIKRNKVVILEDLASKFQLKTQDCIDRIQSLLTEETLVGVIDERGKFIYIVREELEQVARFISQRGRVSISELVDSSNSLINLT
ncbi:DDRGK domain-containing protein 1-like isoform X1 [Ornithodoros turicata]|uniref:DDRGK domain-containing protein 1-like isoform X1 n=1 Tax=Ornithodoros turicata TaxID=34597 RepID=UPI0031394153